PRPSASDRPGSDRPPRKPGPGRPELSPARRGRPPSTAVSSRPWLYPSQLEDDDRTDALAFMHQIEGLVNPLQRQGVGDHRIDLDLAVHVPVDDLRRIGAAPRAAEG